MKTIIEKKDRYARNMFLFFMHHKLYHKRIGELCVYDFRKLAECLIATDEFNEEILNTEEADEFLEKLWDGANENRPYYD